MRQGTITKNCILLPAAAVILFLFSFSARAVPPVVTITSPTSGLVTPATAPITFTATVTDSGANILLVEFLAGNTFLGIAGHSPYSITVSNLPSGRVTLTAIANDTLSTSGTNSIMINVGTTNYIPVVCANIGSTGGVSTNTYLSPGGNVHAGVQFPVFTPPPDSQFYLALNPYGLPVFQSNVDVYAFDGGNGTFTGADYNRGTYLGSIIFPANVTYGQVATLEVTKFVQSVKGPYFGFTLHGQATLSSVAYNYGTPPQIFRTLSTLPPALQPSVAGNQVVVAWTTNNAAGLMLESTTDLTGGGWTPVGTTPTQIGGQLVVTNPVSGPQQFFRLSNQ